MTVTELQQPEESRVLYEDAEHQFIWMGWEDAERHDTFIQTNQCLVVSGEEAVFFDPGGAYVFPHVYEAVLNHVPHESIRHIVTSHQDPDVSSSVPLWLKTTPATLHISQVWEMFITHFGIDEEERVAPIPDTGKALELENGAQLQFIPAHFLHSVGNFQVYDPRSRILFSGDMGASIFPPGERPFFVLDFDSHVRYMEGFHRRYMHSQRVCRNWIERVRDLPIDFMVPQHGAILTADDVPRFLDWLWELECGGDRIVSISGGQ